MANKKVNKFANTNTVKTTENKSAETVVPAAAPVEAKAAAPEVKAPVEAKAEVKTEAEKEEKKPAAKKAPAKKEEAPAEMAVKKDTAKLFIEFGGNKFAADEIVEKCKAAYKADNSRKQVRSIEVYVKPEDNKAYYVVNGKADGLYIDL